jgi:pimeloyl-ACP methyl ester carboxylesterase
MRRLLKRIFLGVISLIVLVSLFVFIYHQYQLKQESELLEHLGEMVTVDGEELHVYSEGHGEDTYVFLAGSGTAAPSYELKGLYSKFLTENKIAVVDRAGYGYSKIFNDQRDIRAMLEQTRKALIQSGHKPPYILVPHSLSGIEAIYWAQKYPGEVKGMIALDIGLPQQYVNYKMGLIDTISIKGMNLLSKIGYHRLIPSAAYNPEVIQQNFLTNYEKEIYKALSYKQFFNNDMKNELLRSYENSQKSIELPLPKETPILFVDAYINKNSKYAKQNYSDYVSFAEQLTRSEVVQLKSTHSVYLYYPDEIYQLSRDFFANEKSH